MSPMLYEPTSAPLDHVMDAVETLLVQLPSQQVELSSSEALLTAIENLEALQRLITQRIEELKHY